MKRTFRRRAAWLPVVATALGASLILPTAANATPLPSTDIAVAAGGSDTTAKVMDEIALAYNNNSGVVGSGTPVSVSSVTKTARVYNIPPFSSTPFVVPGSTDCTADVTWTKDPLAPAATSASTKGIAPFGSGSGKKYLVAENGGTGPGSPAGTDFGCIDVARSSSQPGAIGGGENVATTEYYAYALDAVSWASPSLKAPLTLTPAQLVDIYDCVKRDWSDVGGLPGPIKRYYPQAGSGTRDFFTTEVLGKPKTYVPPTVADPGTACDTEVTFIEENRGKTTGSGATLVQGIFPADFDQAILPYSAAVWSFQDANRINPTLDLRGGAQLRGLSSVATGSPVRWVGSNNSYSLDTTASGVIKETNVKLVDSTPDYPGVRYVYNVLDSVSNRAGYQAAVQLFGFTNEAGGAKSPLCNAAGGTTVHDDLFAAILSSKFAPLSSSGPDSSKNLAGSNCRKYTP